MTKNEAVSQASFPTLQSLSALPDSKVIDAAFQQGLEDLKTLVRIPSVSFEGFSPEEVKRSASAVADLLKKRGADSVRILSPSGAHPYVLAEWRVDPKLPTVLLYAHHDVQPPGREELWLSPPFEPTVRPGPGGDRLYGRGTADDKAGVVVHSAAIDAFTRAGRKLPVNVKLLVEGEEEIGSSHLEEFLQAHRSELSADVMILTDTTNFDCGVPALTTALRGLVAIEVEVRALSKAVHSGMWGGPVPDPVLGLNKMLAGLVDAEGRIQVPGVMDGWKPFSPAEEEGFKKLPYDENEFRHQAGVVDSVQLWKHGPSRYAQLWRMPSLTVTAIQASSRAQPGNIINDAAWAKVTIRVAAGMDPNHVQKCLEKELRARVPWGLQVTLKSECATPAWSTDPVGPAFEAAQAAMKFGYDREPYFIGCGGSIPFAGPFSQALGGVPALLVGVEDPYTNAHGENESLLISDLHKAIRSQVALFQELGVRLSSLRK